MIITITGRPCSGKSPACEHFCKAHNFEYVGAGNFFRSMAKRMGYDKVTDFQKLEDTQEIDDAINNALTEIGKVRAEENVIVDGRTAWHCIPNSFKVYVTVDWERAGKRLLDENRETEHADSLPEAIEMLKNRHENEVIRYKKHFGIDCLDMSNYDLVVDSTKLSTKQLSDLIYNNFKKYIKNKANK